MAESQNNQNHWLIAGWPGMANIAVIAATYLANRLQMKAASELDTRRFFDVSNVNVEGGLVVPPHVPRTLLFQTLQPINNGVDLSVILGESQPAIGSYDYAQSIIRKAEELGVERIVTFASIASTMHPSDDAKVYAAVTQSDMLEEARRLEIYTLEKGQLGGLNGLLLGAAAERGMKGLCLLGEIPYYAAGVPNPKAAMRVLDAFALLAGIDLDLEPLAKDAARVEQILLKLLDRLQKQGGQRSGEFESEPEFPTSADSPESDRGRADQKSPRPSLDHAQRQRIERLFEAAMKDRSKAFELKQELDRLEAFEEFEDRFLDLFRQAE